MAEISNKNNNSRDIKNNKEKEVFVEQFVCLLEVTHVHAREILKFYDIHVSVFFKKNIKVRNFEKKSVHTLLLNGRIHFRL